LEKLWAERTSGRRGSPTALGATATVTAAQAPG